MSICEYEENDMIRSFKNNISIISGNTTFQYTNKNMYPMICTISNVNKNTDNVIPPWISSFNNGVSFTVTNQSAYPIFISIVLIFVPP